MILAGIKTEEYRKICDYWRKRLKGINEHKNVILHFRNGYSPKSRVIITEFLGMNTDPGNSDWGWDANEYYYVLKIGKIIKTENIPSIKKLSLKELHKYKLRQANGYE